MSGRLWRRLAGTTGLVLACATSAWAQMPDPRVMSGQIMPAPELVAGTVTVRIIRQSIVNVVPGIDVQLVGAGEPRHATTGPEGRAEFPGVPIGAHVHAVAIVDGEELQSIEFDVPPAGGVRTMLAAGVGVGRMVTGAAPSVAPATPIAPNAPATPAAPGQLIFGNETRFAIEFQDDTLAVFYLLDIVNSGSAPAGLDKPLVIDLPADASGAALLDGASPLAKVNGRRVTVAGPLPPGVTAVPVAYRVESWEPTWSLTQPLPLPVPEVAVAVQKIGDTRLQGPSAPTIRESTLQGTPFIVATGASLAAGAPLQLTLTGLPHKSRAPVYVTLTLAAALVIWGLWMASAKPADAAETRAARARELAARRDKGLAALAALERRRSAELVDQDVYLERRRALIADLEQVYSELDEHGGLPGGGQGLAA